MSKLWGSTFLVFLFLFPSSAFAATYYVDATGGSNGNSGTDTSHAWQTLSKVNGSTFSAGDQILFKKGEIWNEQLIVPSSGSAGNPITFSSYGAGAQPIFEGADTITSWTSETETQVAAGTNLISQASAFENGAWSKTAASISANVSSPTDPAGGTTADGFITSAANTNHFINQTISASGNTQYTASVYVHAGTSNWIEFIVLESDSGFSTVGSAPQVFVNTSTGTVGTHFNDSTVVTNVGNGWYRIAVTFTSAANAAHLNLALFAATANGTDSFTGDTSSIYTYLYGAKLESGSIATPLAPTTFTAYYASLSTPATFVLQNGTPLMREYSTSTLDAGAYMFSTSTNRLYLRTSGDNNPSGYTIKAAVRPYVSGDYDSNKMPQSASTGLIYLNGKSHLVIDGITMQDSMEYGLGNYPTGAGETDITIKNSSVNYSTQGGITLNSDTQDVTNVAITDNTVNYPDLNQPYGNGALEGIGVRHLNGFEIARNLITNPVIEGIDTAGSSRNGTIHDNEVSGRASFNNNWDGGAPSLYLDGATNISVFSNKLHGNHYGTSGALGIFIDSELTFPSNNLTIYNNLIYDNDVGMAIADRNSNGISNINAYNNTFADNVNGNLTYGGIVFYSSVLNNLTGTNNIKNNIFWGNTGNQILDASTGNYGLLHTSIVNNLFQSGATSEATGTSPIQTADVKFTNEGLHDYSLLLASPAIDAGLNIGTTYQLGLGSGSVWPSSVLTLNQNTNGPTWDVGAYVYPSGPVAVAPAPAAVQGGGSMVYGSGPMAPGYVNTNPTAAAASTTSSAPASVLPTGKSLTEQQIQSILSILASFGADSSTVHNVEASLRGTTIPTAAAGIFSRDLQLGDIGDDVKELQKYLNTHGSIVAQSGPGSDGNETTKFGLATQAALKAFQKAKGITPAAGYFGSKTRVILEK